MKTSKPQIRVTLFWRLFLSLLVTIVLTAILSITVEHWLVKKELTTRMEGQIERLLIQRQALIEVLEVGDMAAVRQQYRQDRRLMSQIRIYDDTGTVMFPRYRGKDEHGQARKDRGQASSSASLSRPSSLEHSRADEAPPNPLIFARLLQPMMSDRAIVTDADDRPELADVTLTLPEGPQVTIQVRPHLRFVDVIELQRRHLPIRILLIIAFSVLVCLWLSRTLTQRIHRVKNSVHRMIGGDYQSSSSLSTMGEDELGLLAKDVATLSARLAESELARKQMLSDISHELRSPLARLDVATELTRDFAPNAARYLDRIDKESARMNELIEHIIHIQSLQMQQYTNEQADSEIVDLSEMITEIGQDVCFEFQHKNVRWQWQPPYFVAPGVPTASWQVMGNHEQLYRALENVIRNAFMHTASSSAVVATIQAVEMMDKTPAVEISIMDAGGGVATKDLKRIFQPFVRLDSARHRDTGGYGLGLAIVHAVVMAHNGQVSGHNRQDGIQGLVVQIVLPLRHA